MAIGALVGDSGEVLVNELGEALTTDVPTTRFGLEGYGVRRASSFGGKAGLDGHPVSRITRFGLEGFGVRRAGSFAGKQGFGSHPVGIITRLGPDGYGVRRCGSFAGKTPATPDVTPSDQGAGGTIGGGWFSRKKWHDLKEILAAQRAAERQAEEAKTAKERAALKKAATKAAQALELVPQATLDELDKFLRMQSLLEAAAGAEKTAARIKAANQAATVAMAIIREIEEEEEMAVFLLLQ